MDSKSTSSTCQEKNACTQSQLLTLNRAWQFSREHNTNDRGEMTMSCIINEKLEVPVMCIEVWTERLILPTDQTSDIDRNDQKQLTVMYQSDNSHFLLGYRKHAS